MSFSRISQHYFAETAAGLTAAIAKTFTFRLSGIDENFSARSGNPSNTCALELTSDPDRPSSKPYLLTSCINPAEIDILVCGHSHACGTIQSLVRVETPDARAIAEDWNIAGLAGPCHKSEYWHAVQQLAPGRIIPIIWDGNQHNADFLFSPAGPFDFFLDGYDLPIESGAQLVPLAILLEHFRPSMAGLAANLAALSKAGARPVVIGTPAPFGDDTFVHERITGFRSAAREVASYIRVKKLNMNASELPVTALPVRVKLWAVIQQLLVEVADQNGVPFIPSPPESEICTAL